MLPSQRIRRKKNPILLLTLLFLGYGTGQGAMLHAQEEAPKQGLTLEKAYEIRSSMLLTKAAELIGSKSEMPMTIDMIEPDAVLGVLAIVYVNRGPEFVAVWDYSKSQMSRVIPIDPQDGDLRSIKFSPNHKHLVIGRSKAILVIDTRTWQVSNTIRPSQAEPEDPREFEVFLLSGISDTIITGIRHEKLVEDHSGASWWERFKTIVRTVALFEINIFKLDDGSLVEGFPFNLTSYHGWRAQLKSLAFALDEDHLAIFYVTNNPEGEDENGVETYSLLSRERVHKSLSLAAASGLDYSPDHKLVFSMLTGPPRDWVFVFDIQSGKLLERLSVHKGRYLGPELAHPLSNVRILNARGRRPFNLSPDGTWIVADSTRTRDDKYWDWYDFRMYHFKGRYQPAVTIWDWRTRKVLWEHHFDEGTEIKQTSFLGVDKVLISIAPPDWAGADKKNEYEEIIEIFQRK